MFRNAVFPISLILLVIILFYSWTISFEQSPWLMSTGTTVLQILIGMSSLVLLYRAYRSVGPERRNFWLLLLAGLCFYIISNWIWLYIYISQGLLWPVADTEDLSYLVRLGAYLFFLAALISKMRELGNTISGNSYSFNITVFMIAAASICFHYLINPMLYSAEEAILPTLTTFVYTVVNMTILFVITIMYYLIRKNGNQEIFLLCIISFLLQVTADFFYAYNVFNDYNQVGHIAVLLWLLSTLFIGFTAYYAKGNQEDASRLVKNRVSDPAVVFPYLSIMILLVLVINTYQGDLTALNIGLLVSFFLVLGRQLQILRKNHQLVKEYRYLAYHDPMTDLRNRGSFVEEIERLLKEYPNRETALLLIDLDQFKVVNDTLGHYVGDQVLIKAARRLEVTMEENMLLFRLGGDEFIMVILDASDEKCISISEKILAIFQESMTIDEYEVDVTPSIGISKFPKHGYTLEKLMKNADAAMYLSKENGKNGYSFYNAELSKEKERKMTIETELKKAIQKNQLQLFYQPKVDLRLNTIIGMEALLRWQHPELGWISPVEFIPVAEETGQIVAIGEWVLREASRQNKQWQRMGYSPLTVSVNVSVLQFKDNRFLDSVRNILDETKLETQYLELEITESIMQNIKESREILETLREIGIKISIDDFGTGYSSLHVLQKLPIDTLKIDKSFVDELDSDVMDPMVKTIIDLGLNMNLTIVAEGVECENQMKLLLQQGCTIGQGYLFSKPVPFEDFEALMEKDNFVSGELEQTS